ncbi:hypothetical protein ABEP42_01320 [Priestia megaterium]
MYYDEYKFEDGMYYAEYNYKDGMYYLKKPDIKVIVKCCCEKENDCKEQPKPPKPPKPPKNS